MIEHINFVERELFIPSYRKLGYLSAAVIGCLLVLYGIAFVRAYFLEKESARLLQEVTELKAQRERVLAEVQKGRGVSGGQTDEPVRKSFQTLPKWSYVLNEMTRRMPAGVWLVSFKTYDKGQAPGGRGVILSGEAEDAQQISLFLQELVASKTFEGPVLSTSKQEEKGGKNVYTFTIDSGLQSPGVGGGS